MKADAAQVRAAMDRGGAGVRLFLLWGPDESAARAAAVRLRDALGPATERTELEVSQLKSEPGRLVDEAASMGLFGESRYIRVAGAADEVIEAFDLLLAAPVAGNPVVAIAPTLKGTSKLVKLVTAAPDAMACAFYPPDGRRADRLANDLAHGLGLSPTGDVATRLAEATGGDTALLSRELEKLALYLDAAPDRPRELGDAALDAVGAVRSEREIFPIIDAVLEGQTATIGRKLDTLRETSPIPLLRLLAKRLLQLIEIRTAVDGGAGLDATVERQRTSFREKDALRRALQRWSSDRLQAALTEVRMAERSLMGSNSAGPIVVEAMLLRLARVAARAR